jgi:hypothetical protein
VTCVWTPDEMVLGAEWAALTQPERNRALTLATSSLQMLTLYRVGLCPITIRPLVTDLNQYDIPGPVGYIEKLKIDGVEVDVWNGDWRLDDGHLLVWQGAGNSPLAGLQDLSLPDTSPGTWSLSYSRSYPVLEDGRLAVAMLAMEFSKAFKPKSKCALPRGVTNVVRNGVSFTIEAGLFPRGLTGIDMVDAFIIKWAPSDAPTRTAVVFDPNSKKFRTTNTVPRKPVVPLTGSW